MTTKTEAALRATEDQLADARRTIAALAQWIHNPAYDLTARIAAAHTAGLPAPTSPKADPPTQENR